MTPGAAPPPDDRALHATLLFLLAVLLLAGSVPFFAAAYVFRWFHSGRVLVLVILALLPLALPALVVWRGAAPPVPDDAAGPGPLSLAALWGACLAALALVLLAVAMTSQTLDLRLVAQAQRNTVWYVLGQPVGALLFVAAAALATHLFGASPGGRGLWPAAATVATELGLGAVFSFAFLAGGAGPVLPGWAWLLLKAVAAATVIAAVARAASLRSFTWAQRSAWLAAGLAVLNVIATAAYLALRTRPEP